MRTFGDTHPLLPLVPLTRLNVAREDNALAPPESPQPYDGKQCRKAQNIVQGSPCRQKADGHIMDDNRSFIFGLLASVNISILSIPLLTKTTDALSVGSVSSTNSL